MKLYLYLKLLDRLLTQIKQGLESDSVIVNNVTLNKITLEVEKLERVYFETNDETVKELISLYNNLYDKAKHYFQDTDSNIRKEYLQSFYSQIRGKLFETILFLDESGLKL